MSKLSERLADPKHPLWPFLNTVVVALVITVVLAFNAEHFDETELKAVGWFLAFVAGWEGYKKWKIEHQKEKNDE